MTNYEKLKQVIQAANPGRDWRVFWSDDVTIRLADVLLAMVNKFYGDNIPKYEDYASQLCMGYWNLKDDNLDNQSEECKKFLIKLLCKE